MRRGFVYLRTTGSKSHKKLIKTKNYGEMTALKGIRIVGVPLEKVYDGIKTVNMSAYNVASKFFAK